MAKARMKESTGDVNGNRTGMETAPALLNEYNLEMRQTTAAAEREFLAIRLYSRLAYVYWFCAGKVPCAWAHLREMNLAERYPPSLELAQAYSEHAPVMTMAPWYSRGLRYAQRSLAIRRELGDAAPHPADELLGLVREQHDAGQPDAAPARVPALPPRRPARHLRARLRRAAPHAHFGA